MSASPSTGTPQAMLPATSAEQLRLAELACYAITPGQTDPKLDAITQVAVQVAGGDIGGISLIYQSEIWLPSRVGIDVTHVPRAGSFCTVAIEGGTDGLFEVPDARTDARFNRNSLVTGASPFLHYAAVPLRGGRGHMLGTLWMMRAAPGRLSEQQAGLLSAVAKIVVDTFELRYSNEVTGMANRPVFLHHLQAQLDKPSRSDVSVGHIDLIGFRQINDVFGRASGDTALRILAKRLSEWAGPGNQVSHLGGAKFAFALTGDANYLAERIDALRSRVSEQFLLESGSPQTLQARIGTVLHKAGHAALATTLMDAADTAASSISRTVQHTTVLEYSDDLMTRSHSIVELQGALDGEPGCGVLTAYYQPQVDFANGRVIGLEALARWRHPTQGLLMPAQFIKLAESSGKIYQLDNVVLTQVCHHLREWLDAGLAPVPVSFNYSRSSLLHGDVIDDFHDSLARFRIPAQLLELEITETELLENLATISGRVDQFRALGVRIAVDDFGTGYSNLDALSSFPFDRLKVDRQFVDGVASSARIAGLFHLIQGIAVLFNAELLCEGVEHADDIRWLAQHGAFRAQGRYFSAERPSADIVRILTTLRDRPGDAAPLDAEQLRALLMQA